jgi:hypothetical protein
MATTREGRRGGSGASRLSVVAVLGATAAGLVLAGPVITEQAAELGARVTAECTVRTDDGRTPLSTEQAQRATTAVALAARGREGPDTEDVPPQVLDLLADGPSDDAGPVLSCRAQEDPALAREEPGDSGLTPRAEGVLEAMGEVFGELSLGGFAPGGVDSGHGAESTHYDGRAVDVFYRPVSEESRREGWVLAHWLVAHAEDLHIQYVIWDDRYWGVRGSDRGWRSYDAPPPADEVLRHLDHVHVDVLRGT